MKSSKANQENLILQKFLSAYVAENIDLELLQNKVDFTEANILLIMPQ